MTRILRIDSSARTGIRGLDPHGSHSRALTHRFVSRWRAADPQLQLVDRDVGRSPPRPIMQDWIAAAFTAEARRTEEMRQTLRESDALIAELRAADIVLIGSPMYNYGPPASLKAWVDNIVRVGVTFAFDAAASNPHQPLLVDKPRTALLLSSCGESGLGPQGPQAHRNHLQPLLQQVLELIGIGDLRCIAIENDEFGGPALEQSVAQAMARVDSEVDALLQRHAPD